MASVMAEIRQGVVAVGQRIDKEHDARLALGRRVTELEKRLDELTSEGGETGTGEQQGEDAAGRSTTSRTTTRTATKTTARAPRKTAATAADKAAAGSTDKTADAAADNAAGDSAVESDSSKGATPAGA